MVCGFFVGIIIGRVAGLIIVGVNGGRIFKKGGFGNWGTILIVFVGRGINGGRVMGGKG